MLLQVAIILKGEKMKKSKKKWVMYGWLPSNFEKPEWDESNDSITVFKHKKGTKDWLDWPLRRVRVIIEEV